MPKLKLMLKLMRMLRQRGLCWVLRLNSVLKSTLYLQLWIELRPT